MIMLKYIIAKKYNKYLKYNKNVENSNQNSNPNSTKPDIYRFLIVYLFIIY